MNEPSVGGVQGKAPEVFVVPSGATWFAVEKLVQVRAPVEKDGDGEPDSTAYRTVEKWKTQWIAHPTEEGVKVNKTPIPAGTDLDAAQVRQGIAETWGFGFYRLRWSTGGRTSPFEIVDPAKTEAPPPAFGGRPRRGGVGSVAFDGSEAVAAPVDGLALLPPEIRQFMAMQTVMASLTRGEEARRAEQDRKQFELLLRVVDNRGAAPASGGLDARDLKIALLETVAPLREEISALKLDNARMRRAIEERPNGDDDDEDIDWDEPLGTILGKEVKKGIVEVASEITPEVVPFLKEAIPAMFAHLKSKMQEEKAKALAKAAGGVQ